MLRVHVRSEAPRPHTGTQPWRLVRVSAPPRGQASASRGRGQSRGRAEEKTRTYRAGFPSQCDRRTAWAVAQRHDGGSETRNNTGSAHDFQNKTSPAMRNNWATVLY